MRKVKIDGLISSECLGHLYCFCLGVGLLEAKPNLFDVSLFALICKEG